MRADEAAGVIEQRRFREFAWRELQDWHARGVEAQEGRRRNAWRPLLQHRRDIAETSPLPPESALKRDPRVDVLRGLALLMIFVDHIPDDVLSLVTMRNFGFSDAAEMFVLLAGFSSMLAYGKVFERDGARIGLRRIVMRIARLYLFQVGLLLTTLGVGLMWTTHYHQRPIMAATILDAPIAGLAHALTLRAVPNYLDVLPLYIVLLAAFPLVYVGIRKKTWLTLSASAAIWLAANLDDNLNLPNWIGGKSWFFDPFAWQFLFTIGVAMATLSASHDGALPRVKWLSWLCGAYLAFAFFESAPWAAWHLPSLRPIAMPPPDKTHLGAPRLLDILALAYVLLSSAKLRILAGKRWLRPLEACGRHSLEVFGVGCILALFGRLLFSTDGAGLEMQIAVNALGLATMCLVGFWLERRRFASSRKTLATPGVAASATAAATS
ncbi:MAG: protein of unassigned function [Rhodospirillales bacterium]|nr:protein of unassigned function [Rhodospirillales bacterium]